jgi:hypothetical protein
MCLVVLRIKHAPLVCLVDILRAVALFVWLSALQHVAGLILSHGV